MAVFSYDSSDPSSNRDRVRLYLGDVDGSVIAGPRKNWTIYLTDGEIDQLLSDNGSDVYLSAAAGCEVIAKRYRSVASNSRGSLSGPKPSGNLS